MKPLADLVIEHRTSLGMTTTEYAAAIGVSRQNLENVESGRVKQPRWIAQLAAFMGRSSDELLGVTPAPSPQPAKKNEGNPTVGGVPNEPQPEYAGSLPFVRRVPVVGAAKLGDNGWYEEVSTITGAGDGYVEVYTKDKNAYALVVRGDSMHPAIKDGWLVLVEPNSRPTPGEYVLVKLRDGRKMVKELLYERRDSVAVISVNGDKRMTIPREDIEAVQAVGPVIPPSMWRPD